jgi:hypothetical protein
MAARLAPNHTLYQVSTPTASIQRLHTAVGVETLRERISRSSPDAEVCMLTTTRGDGRFRVEDAPRVRLITTIDVLTLLFARSALSAACF